MTPSTTDTHWLSTPPDSMLHWSQMTVRLYYWRIQGLIDADEHAELYELLGCPLAGLGDLG